MKKTTLSVLIPNYNHAPFLADTINSVLSQDFDDFELLVGDDASTDNSVEIIKSYGDRIRPFFFKKNRGYFATIQDLFKEARGMFVHMFSSDDLYLPGFLSTSMKLMFEHQLKLTCSNIRYFSKESSRETKLYDKDVPTAFHKEEIVDVFRRSNFWITGVSCITEIETLKKYGLPNPRLENISDWFLFHKIALFEGVGYVPQLGIAMREQASSYTSKVKKDRKRRNATYRAVLDLVSKDREERKKFRDSTVLVFIFDNLFWKLIVRPIWWDFFWKGRTKISVKKRITKSIGKKIKRVWT